MKKLVLRQAFVLVFPILVLLGCQGAQRTTEKAAKISLRLKLPKAFAPGTAHYRQLIERAAALRLYLGTELGEIARLEYPALQWPKFFLPKLRFPHSPKDKLKIQAEVWDGKANGVVRDYPLFVGRTSVSAKDVRPGRPSTIGLILTLYSAEAAGEWDP